VPVKIVVVLVAVTKQVGGKLNRDRPLDSRQN